MNKYILILLCAFFTVSINAQEDAKYMEGAVPEKEGKVIFEKTIIPEISISDADLYDLMLKWAKDNYESEQEKGLDSRILFQNSAKRDIACYGEEYLVFKSSFIVLDRAKMSYQLIMSINSGKCDLAVRGIRYDYGEEKNILAENMITDKVAVNSKKNKLNNHYDKFRRSTIDSVEQIFTSIEVYLNGDKPKEVAPTRSKGAVADLNKQQNQKKEEVVMGMPNYKNISVDKIPSKLMNDWTLITSGSKNSANVIPALWGGTGSMGTNAVAFSLLNQTQGGVRILDKEDTYVISFYTEIYQDALDKFRSTEGSIEDKIKESGLTPIQTSSGAMAFAEAWMIIECKKGTAQPSAKAAVAGADGMNKDNYNQTYIGEILNVWAK